MCDRGVGQWQEASRQRELLLAYLQQQSGVGTMLDTRRTRDYDADGLVDQYLNLKDVQVVALVCGQPIDTVEQKS